jgi:hypothetical protein
VIVLVVALVTVVMVTSRRKSSNPEAKGSAKSVAYRFDTQRAYSSDEQQ